MVAVGSHQSDSKADRGGGVSTNAGGHCGNLNGTGHSHEGAGEGET